MNFRGDPFHIPVSDDPFYPDRRSDRHFGVPHSTDNMFYERPASSFHHFPRAMPEDYWPSSAFHGRSGWPADRPIKVNFERGGRSDAESETSSRCSSTSSGSAGQPKVHHIPIMVESRDGSAPYVRQTEPEMQQQEHVEKERTPTPPKEHTSPPQSRQSPVKENVPTSTTTENYSPQENNAQTEPDNCFREHRIPIQVERTESSPVIGEMARRRLGKGAGEPLNQGFTNTFPRQKVTEAPLSGFRNFFMGGGSNRRPQNQKEADSKGTTGKSVPTRNSAAGGGSDVTETTQPTQSTSAVAAAALEKERVARLSPKEKIADVMFKLKDLSERVHKFEGAERTKEFRYLDEMLTRLMLTLDNIETDVDEIRQSRRAAVKAVQEVISKLESKARALVVAADSTVVPSDDGVIVPADDGQTTTTQAMETVDVTETTRCCAAADTQPMEIDLSKSNPTEVGTRPEITESTLSQQTKSERQEE